MTPHSGRTAVVGAVAGRANRTAGLRAHRRLIALAAWWLPAFGVAGDPAELLAARPANEPAVSEMLSRIGPAAHRLDTDHFVLVVTTAEPLAREYAARLEAVYRAHVRFAEDLGLPARPPRHKLEVYFLGTHGEFEAQRAAIAAVPNDALGFYDPQANRCAFFDLETAPALAAARAMVAQAPPEERPRLQSRLERRRTLLALSIVQHEAAHQVQANLGLLPQSERVPTWLREGLATLFEVPCEGPLTPRLPLNGYRLHEFRKLYPTPAALPDVRRLLSDEAAWCGGPCYPLAWAATRYLWARQPTAFTALLRQAADPAGWPAGSAERAALVDKLVGPLDTAWITRLHAETLALPLDESTWAE